jgi:4-hydroxybenzoate polyprenyltransferase
MGVVDAVPASGLLARLKATLEMVRFSHSVFALPFALLSLVVASGGMPTGRVLAWVLVAMVCARSAAMAVNRIADRDVDAGNPRTARRHLVTGALSVRFAVAFAVACAGGFVLAAAMLNATALALSPAVLAVLLGYSWLKRFTAAAHLGVGLALGLSPLGAWVAGAGGLVGDLRVPILLGAAVVLWVAGFDVIYACQDVESDRHQGLHSLPAKVGVAAALRVSTALHALGVVGFAAVGIVAPLGVAWWGALALVAALLAFEHAIVSPDNLARVDTAFFTINGVVALVLGAAGTVDVLLRR